MSLKTHGFPATCTRVRALSADDSRCRISTRQAPIQATEARLNSVFVALIRSSDTFSAAFSVRPLGEQTVAMGEAFPFNLEPGARFATRLGAKLCGRFSVLLGGCHWSLAFTRQIFAGMHRRIRRRFLREFAMRAGMAGRCGRCRKSRSRCRATPRHSKLESGRRDWLGRARCNRAQKTCQARSSLP